MKAVVLELGPELLELLLFGTGSVGLAVVGAYIERFALVTAGTGQLKLGVWLAGMGALAFYFAYLLSTDKFGPRLAEVRRSRADREP